MENISAVSKQTSFTIAPADLAEGHVTQTIEITTTYMIIFLEPKSNRTYLCLKIFQQ